MATQTRDRHLYLAFGVRKLEKLNGFRLHVPRTGGLPALIHRPGQHRVVAFCATIMLTVGRVVLQLTYFIARRTVAFVAIVTVLVMTFGGFATGQETLGWLGFLRSATRNFNDRSLAATLEAGL